MKYNQKTIKKIEKECNLCRNSFSIWLTTLNFDQEREENIKDHLYSHCHSCKVLESLRRR